MTQSIEYVVRVATENANKAIADLELRWRGVGNSAAIAGGKMDRAAGGTRNFGQAALEGSRALEDLQYGIGGVVNNIPSLVMGLGMGAGVAGAISVVAVGASQLYKNWDAVSAAFGSSTADIKAVKGAIKDLGEAFDKDLNGKLKDARTQLKDLRDELRDFGLTSRDKTLEEQARNIEEMEARRDRLAENRRFLQAKANAAESARDKERFKEQQAILDEADRRARDLDKALKEARSTYVQTARTIAELRAKDAEEEKRRERERARGKRTVEEAMKIESGDDGDANRRLEAEQEARERMNERMLNRQLAADEKAERERTRLLQAEARERERIREQEAEHARRLREQEIEHYQMIGSALGSAVGAFAVQAATGQEAAFANLIAAASDLAGGQIMLEGGKVMASGIAGMLVAPNPASAAQIAGGFGLVAAGEAVRQIGPAAVSMLSGKANAGSGGGPSGAMRDPGASPRTSGGTGGGPLVLNVTYGVAGPLPEDTARAIHRELRSGDRRSGR